MDNITNFDYQEFENEDGYVEINSPEIDFYLDKINNAYSHDIDNYIDNPEIEAIIKESVYYGYICETYECMSEREKKLMALSCIIFLFLFVTNNFSLKR